MRQLPDEIDRLMEQVDELPFGVQKYELMKHVVGRAERECDLQTYCELRTWFARICAESGFCHESLVACSWCSGMFDKHPEFFDPDTLLDLLSWGVTYARSCLQVSVKQVFELLEDYEARSAQFENGASEPISQRVRTALLIGDFKMAKDSFQKFLLAGAGDDVSSAYEHIFRTDYLVDMGQEDEAISLGLPFLDNCRIKEAVVYITSFLLLPLARKGDFETADRLQRRSAAHFSKHSRYEGEVNSHIIYLSARNRFAQAIRLFERRLITWIKSTDDHENLFFASAAGILFRDLIETGRKQVSLVLPVGFQLRNDEGKYEARELQDFFREFAKDMAARFDVRHGNDVTSQRVQKEFELRAEARRS